MARAKYINATLSGKLSDSVYSRNLGGSYVRSYGSYSATPSTPQNNAWTRFATSASNWNSLTNSQKDKWNEHEFLNHKLTGKSGYTKFNYFNYNVLNALNMQLLPTGASPVTTVRMWGGTPTYVNSNPLINYSTPTEPPELSNNTGFIINETDGVLFPKPGNAYLRRYGFYIQSGYRLNFTGNPTFKYLKDINGYYCGLFSVMSDPVNYKTKKPKNLFNNIIGFTFPINYPTGYANITQLQLTGFSALQVTNYKIVPANNQYAHYSLFSINQKGETNLLYSEIKLLTG